MQVQCSSKKKMAKEQLRLLIVAPTILRPIFLIAIVKFDNKNEKFTAFFFFFSLVIMVALMVPCSVQWHLLCSTHRQKRIWKWSQIVNFYYRTSATSYDWFCLLYKDIIIISSLVIALKMDGFVLVNNKQKKTRINDLI